MQKILNVLKLFRKYMSKLMNFIGRTPCSIHDHFDYLFGGKFHFTLHMLPLHLFSILRLGDTFLRVYLLCILFLNLWFFIVLELRIFFLHSGNFVVLLFNPSFVPDHITLNLTWFCDALGTSIVPFQQAARG